MTASAIGREREIIEANAGLIDVLLAQHGHGRCYLAEEYRSEANLALFRAARALATSDRAHNPAFVRNYLARAIRTAFVDVYRRFRGKRRRWTPLDGELLTAIEPPSREADPAFLAELAEHPAVAAAAEPAPAPAAGNPRRKAAHKLDARQEAQLEALILDNPGASNLAITRAFFAATYLRIRRSSVTKYRAHLGVAGAALAS